MWKLKLNEQKSTHINFTNKNIRNFPPVTINGTIIPYETNVKYLGMTLDARLRWKVHVKKKREELGLKYRKLYWLLGRNSQLSIYNKILIYNLFETCLNLWPTIMGMCKTMSYK